MSKNRNHSITFRSNLQEELSLGEILCCLKSNTSSSLQQQKRLLATIIEKQARITNAFNSVSQKLAYSFVYCLPKAVPIHKLSEKLTAKAIFKLAVLYDVYQRSLMADVDGRIESLFEGAMALVDSAKFEARQQRHRKFAYRVMGMIDSVTKESLSASTARDDNKGTIDTSMSRETKKRAIRRYRALIGLGDRAISRDQLFRVVSDLLRINPSILVHEVSVALDHVIGIDQT